MPVVDPEEFSGGLHPVFTEQLEPDIPEAITLELAHGEVSQEQTVSVVGSTTPPMSIMPGRLVLVSGMSHEILVRNNSQEGILVAEIPTPADFLAVGWATLESADIAPGSDAILNVIGDAERTPEDWSGGVVWLAEPVAGRMEATIPVLRRFP